MMRAGLPVADRRRRAVLDERRLGADEEEVGAWCDRGALEAEVQPHAVRPGGVQQEGTSGTNSARSWWPVEVELAHPRVDQSVGEALGRDHEGAIVRECQPFRVEAGGRERLSVRVAERRDADDLNGGSTAGDGDPERVEAYADLVVGERVEDDCAGASYVMLESPPNVVPRNWVAVGKICCPRNSSCVDGRPVQDRSPRAQSRAARRVSSHRSSSRSPPYYAAR